MPPELEAPPLPLEYSHVVDWFEDLDGVRNYTMAGAQPISYTEIAAWALLKEVDPTPDEVQLLRMLDITQLNTLAKHQAKEIEKSEKASG